jgi:hypothetical protein
MRLWKGLNRALHGIVDGAEGGIIPVQDQQDHRKAHIDQRVGSDTPEDAKNLS